MKSVISAAFAKKIDQYTMEAKGIPSLVLMERAAYECVSRILELVSAQDRILCICGSGNNGGDGVCIARILKVKGYQAEILLCGNQEKRSEALQTQIRIAQNYQVPFVEDVNPSEYRLIVDAIFGIGSSRNLTGELCELVDTVNASGTPVLSVDMPSGIHTDTGRVLGTAIRATETITFTDLKPGLLLYPGKEYAGQVLVREIGISTEDHKSEIDQFMLESSDLACILDRDPTGNKGTFGKVLIIAGCDTIFGACAFSALGALKSGCGMVKVLTERSNRVPLFSLLPEVLADFWDKDQPIDRTWLSHQLEWADSVVIGPGLGTSDQALSLLDHVLRKFTKPVVLDADACNLISENPELIEVMKKNPGFRLMTPHAGELSRLLHMPISELKLEAAAFARKAVKRFDSAVVFKDAVSVLCGMDASSNLLYFYSPGGCSALATAGSGDVLAGICGSFLARRELDPDRNGVFLAALAVYVHGLCGEAAAGASNASAVTASDIARALEVVLDERK